nr:putative ribonuclease h protein [Quercus suber]
MQWRVGNGASIGIYRDAWLPPPQPSKVISPQNSLDTDARVSVLIDHDRKCWIEGVIDNIFLPSDASRIKAIPLSLANCDDCVFWPRNPNGTFSVKSGYKLLMESEWDDLPTTSDPSRSKKVWNGIWSLRIPNRVKSLMWRAGLDSLPTRTNLRKRRLITDDICPHCNLNSESSLHALWSCPSLLPIWKVHFDWLLKDSWNCRSLLDIFQLCHESSDLLDLFAMISSLIWARRNQLRVGESATPVDRICSMAVANLQEFRRASPPPLRTPPSVSPAKQPKILQAQNLFLKSLVLYKVQSVYTEYHLARWGCFFCNNFAQIALFHIAYSNTSNGYTSLFSLALQTAPKPECGVFFKIGPFVLQALQLSPENQH